MEAKKQLEWSYYNYSIHPDKNRIYCRMANKVMKFDSGRCFHCPLWNGDCREVHCAYDGPMIEAEAKPTDVKKLMDGVIAIGMDTEFPAFTDTKLINFAGRAISESWTRQDFKKIEKAYQFAASAHKGQFRKGTSIPYITHPVEASIIAFELSNNVSVVVGAILHDVVEDTDYTIRDIEGMLGDEIAWLVRYESEDKRRDLPSEESWKMRKQEFLEHLAIAPVSAKAITLADKLSNMRAIAKDFDSIGDAIWERFNQKNKIEHEWYYREIAELTKEYADTDRYREYVELCDKVFVR